MKRRITQRSISQASDAFDFLADWLNAIGIEEMRVDQSKTDRIQWRPRDGKIDLDRVRVFKDIAQKAFVDALTTPRLKRLKCKP